ncbi:hypothetical protein HBB16_13440 [Pseudonocardia sp. MCCB 268]|nr:hypothetical protein [Pseudonocardia cytotoxica]
MRSTPTGFRRRGCAGLAACARRGVGLTVSEPRIGRRAADGGSRMAARPPAGWGRGSTGCSCGSCTTGSGSRRRPVVVVSRTTAQRCRRAAAVRACFKRRVVPW